MLTDLVNVTTSDGYRLDGALFVPAPGTAKTLNIDALICVHGATGNFYGPSFFEKAVERLLEHGVAVLRVNTRGHDIAFPTTKGYMGAAYEILDDSRKDLQSWLGFLEGRGYKAFGVWGHSLGAVKTVFCLAKDKDARVKVAAASSPPRFNYKNHAASDKGANFLNFVKKAEEAVAAGRPWELLMVDTPLPGLFSAGCYRDKYGPEDTYDYLPMLASVHVPIMVTLGALESGTYYDDLKGGGEKMAGEMDGMGYKLVEGADHLYSGKYEELWNVVGAFLKEKVGK